MKLEFTEEELLNEEWRPVVGYEGLYEVSNLGRVKRLERRFKYVNGKEGIIEESILKPSAGGRGYRIMKIRKEGKRSTFQIHRLVMKAFIGESDLDVNHKDGNKLNNRLSNLEYCTRQENILHAWRTGLRPRKYKKNCLD